MSESGRVAAVNEVYVGDELAADAATGATVLQLTEAGDFPAGGGSISTDLGILTYSVADLDLNQITVPAGLPSPGLLAGDQIYLYSQQRAGIIKEVVAEVELDGAEENAEPLAVPVPHHLQSLLPVGIRDTTLSEFVEIAQTLDGRWELAEIDGLPVRQDAGSLDPATYQAANLTGLDIHNAAVASINADIDATNAQVAAGDSANATAINNEVNDRIAAVATKSKHTLSSAAPTTSDAGNAGDVWERYETASGSSRIIGRWRLMNSVSPYSWQAMSLDATYIPLLDIGSGTFGDLSGTRVAASSLTSKQVVIADMENLFADLENAAERTSYPATAGWAYDIFPANSEGDRYRVKFSGGGALSYNEFYFGPLSQIEPGDEVYITFDAYRQGANYGIHVGFQGWESNDSTVSSYDIGISVGAGVTDNTWISYGGAVVMPAGTRIIRPRFKVASNNPTSTGSWYVRNVKVRRRAKGTLIVDGAILARHVTADMVNGLLITGNVLQTNALANRGIKISTSGLVAYNSSGTAVTTIDPSTGVITAIGGFSTAGAGQRVVVDPSTNALLLFGGYSGEVPSKLDQTGINPTLLLACGTTASAPYGPSIQMASAASNNNIITYKAAQHNFQDLRDGHNWLTFTDQVTPFVRIPDFIKTGTANSGTLVAGTDKTVTVTFGTPWPDASYVVAHALNEPSSGGTNNTRASVTNKTANGFDMLFYRSGGTAALSVAWVAVRSGSPTN